METIQKQLESALATIALFLQHHPESELTKFSYCVLEWENRDLKAYEIRRHAHQVFSDIKRHNDDWTEISYNDEGVNEYDDNWYVFVDGEWFRRDCDGDLVSEPDLTCAIMVPWLI